MKRWLWSGRIRPARRSWFGEPNAPSARGHDGRHFKGVGTPALRGVEGHVAFDAFKTAIVDIATLERSAFSGDEQGSAPKLAIEARLRQRALARYASDGAAMVVAWSGELTSLMQTIAAATDSERKNVAVIKARVPLIGQVRDAASLVDSIVVKVLSWSSDGQFRPGGMLAKIVARNIARVSGMSEKEAGERAHKLVWPKASKLPATEMVEKYLGGTPFATLLLSPIDWGIGTAELVEGVHGIGRTGSGKSQLIEYFVLSLLKTPDPPSLVIIDSQGTMLERIGRLQLFAAGGRLADRLAWIDPRERDAVALNAFARKSDRMGRYSPVVREQLENTTIDLLEHVLDGILGAGLTGKQELLLRYIVKLLLTIPGASIATVLDVFKEPARFAPAIARLGGRERQYLEEKAFGKSNSATREQIERRIFQILEQRTFERMLTSPEAKLDWFDALQKGSVVLVNTAKDFLGASRSSVMARLIVAMVLRGISERAAIPENMRRPTFLIIDEAHDVLDRSAEEFAVQARKFRAGLWAFHQHLAQLEPGLRKNFASNMGVKLVGGVSDHDARELADDLGVAPGFLTGLSRGKGTTTFALHVRNLTRSAIPLVVPLGALNGEPRMSGAEWQAVLARNRVRYGSTAQSTGASAPRISATKSNNKDSDDLSDDWRS